MSDTLLAVRDLRTYFHTDIGVARAVDGVSFDVGARETVGLVGESGCGKSVTSLSILRLIARPGRIEPGSRIEFEGRDLLALSEPEMRSVRGNRISMIFQEPMSALNPVFTAGDQIAEVARVHARASRREAWNRAVEMMRLTGISDPERRAKQYPHQLSGGMRQRVMIAMALMMSPALLIADEPTTALDVTIQAQILELLGELQEQIGTSVILITHDLGVVASVADRIAVMYAGKIVETGTVRETFYDPQMPYTWGLLASIPLPNADRSEDLIPIPGSPPDMSDPPEGCPFAARCPYAMRVCPTEFPEYTTFSAEHKAACWLHHPMAPNVEPPARIGGAR